MDLSKLNTRNAADKPAEMRLKNPYTGETIKGDDDKPVTFSLLGFQSSTARNLMTAQKRRKGEQDQDELGAELLATITTGWSNNFEIDGEKPKYSKKAAEKLYLGQEWIALQCTRFAAELGNYNPEL